MKRETILLYIAIAILAGLFLYHYSKKSKTNPDPGQKLEGASPPQQENIDDSMELFDHPDISDSPGFGIGEGLVGFGRFGSSFMA